MNKRLPHKCLQEIHAPNPQCQHFALHKNNINWEAVTEWAKPALARQKENSTLLCYRSDDDFG